MDGRRAYVSYPGRHIRRRYGSNYISHYQTTTVSATGYACGDGKDVIKRDNVFVLGNSGGASIRRARCWQAGGCWMSSSAGELDCRLPHIAAGLSNHPPPAPPTARLLRLPDAAVVNFNLFAAILSAPDILNKPTRGDL